MTRKVAIVSGAAQGLGRAFAQRLAEEGYTVLPFDRQESVTDLGNGMIANVAIRDDVERVISAACDLGEIEIVINNAGNWRRTPVDASWEQALEDWDFIMDTNVRGVLLLSRAATPHLIAHGSGHIINISTVHNLKIGRI